MKRTRVCCYCDVWENGGIESFLKNVLCRLDLQRMEVDIVAASIHPSIFSDELKAKGIRFIELSGRKTGFIANYRRFGEIMRENRYDVIHFNLFQGLSLMYLHLAKKMGIPVRIVHSHNTALNKSRTRCVKMLLHNAGKLLFSGDATELWACSEKAARFLFASRILRQKGFRFIPNGIDTERFRFDPAVRDQIRGELNIADRFVIGHIGRFCYQKNQEFLLEAFEEVLKKRKDSVLLLVGTGEMEQELKERAKKVGLDSRVIFYGTTNRAEHLLWAMDVFAFPSRFEGLGIAAVEAQAAGLQVICSEHVPREAYVTDRMQEASLTSGASAWADKLLLNEREQKRELAAEEVRSGGFDIADVADGIARSYLGE